MFTTNHHKQLPPIENQEEDTTLSTILKKTFLKLKNSIEELGEGREV